MTSFQTSLLGVDNLDSIRMMETSNTMEVGCIPDNVYFIRLACSASQTILILNADAHKDNRSNCTVYKCALNVPLGSAVALAWFPASFTWVLALLIS